MTDDPRHAQLRRLRFAEQQRVHALTARLNETDAERHPRAFDALRDSVEQAKQRLGEIEGELAGDQVTVVQRPDGDADTARDTLRNRFEFLLLALRHAPPSCATATRRLKQGIRRELRAIGR